MNKRILLSITLLFVFSACEKTESTEEGVTAAKTVAHTQETSNTNTATTMASAPKAVPHKDCAGASPDNKDKKNAAHDCSGHKGEKNAAHDCSGHKGEKNAAHDCSGHTEGQSCENCDQKHNVKQATTSNVPADAKWKIFKVSGMTCEGCQNKIIASLNKIKGVVGVKADFKSGEVQIATLTEDLAITKSSSLKISELGFTVVNDEVD